VISSLDISTSALVAQRVRLDAISSNIANLTTQVNENGGAEPYQARYVIFQADDSLKTKHGAVGVRVASVETSQVEPHRHYQPGHPMADADGYVNYPAINMTQEFVDALSATRAYEANVGVIETTKNMGQQTLRILA
jgi:flagellar basal-body rod protein FlgC